MTKEEWKNITNNNGAYESLYKDCFKKFYDYGKKFTPNTSIIEDAIQEVFLDIWVNKQKLLHVSSINSYLFSAFRYILLKKTKKEKKLVSSEEFKTEPEFSVDVTLIANEVNEEVKIQLEKALMALTSHQREAVFLRFYQGFSYEEVAGILHISVKATYKIIARSLSSLKESMLISLAVVLIITLFEKFFQKTF